MQRGFTFIEFMITHTAVSVKGLYRDLAGIEGHYKKHQYCMQVFGQSLDEIEKVIWEMIQQGFEFIPDPECNDYDATGRCKGHANL